MENIEIVGILASVFVAVSLTMKNIKWLRVINMIGAVFFVVYGSVIHSISVAGMNTFVIGINIYYLVKLHRAKSKQDHFDVSMVNPAQDAYVQRFISFHLNDIKRFFPSFDPDLNTGTLANAQCCFILRETLPVSLLAFRSGSVDEIVILLDYVVPSYRDYQSAKFFFETGSRTIKTGSIFTATAEVPSHGSYLKRIGFKEIEKTDKGIVYQKKV
ncbi:MAG: hypothetical protein LBI28_03155 [Treponema sp.]|jgi:hypothetical protein|nr:hypothetical protein [Treponema sp.]